MKILFIFPKIGSGATWNVGIASMSAVLKRAGHKANLFEISDLDEGLTKLLKQIQTGQPDLISISTNSHQYSYAKKIAGAIKKVYSLPILIGGIHPILFPELLAEETVFDGLCTGEGEEALLELVEKMKAGQNYLNTAGLWFRQDKNIIKNRQRQLINDLDQLPFPDRSIFQYFKERRKITPRFIFSRGCPFNCAYCCNHALREKYAGLGEYLRFRSVDKAIEEIRDLKQKYDFHHIKLDDDTFSINKNWLLEFCEKFSKNFDMTFECNIRPGSVDEESLVALKKGNCVLIKVGVETGNEQLRKNVLNRNILNQEILSLFQKAKNLGLKTHSFNMVGIPGETKESVKETIGLNAKIQPDLMQVSVFYPYLGTKLGQECLRAGLINKDSADSYMRESILKLPTISKKEIERVAKNFKFNVYKQYDIKKAILVKKEQVKDSIISKPSFKFFARPIYRLLKPSKGCAK